MTEPQEKNLENNFFYRLLKVAYITSFIACVLIAVVAGWSERPQNYVDREKSYLACDNGEVYTLEAAEVSVGYGDTKLDSYDEDDARKVCAYAITSDWRDEYSVPTYKNYILHVNHRVRGSWGSVLIWWFLGIGGSYIVLNIVRETILYIVFGKKLSWEWFRVIWDFVNDNW